MPLPKNSVQPVRVSHVAVPPGVEDELQYVANATLCNLMRQMASISQVASSMFEELTAALSNSVERTMHLQQRLTALQEDVQAMRCGNEEFSSNSPPLQLPPFVSKKPADSQVLNHNTIPPSMQASYDRAEPIPPLQQMDRLRDDGKNSVKLYSDPSFFFDLWSREMLEKHKHRRVAKKNKQRPKSGKPSMEGLADRGESNHQGAGGVRGGQIKRQDEMEPSSPSPPPKPLLQHSWGSRLGRLGSQSHPAPPQLPLASPSVGVNFAATAAAANRTTDVGAVASTGKAALPNGSGSAGLVDNSGSVGRNIQNTIEDDYLLLMTTDQLTQHRQQPLPPPPTPVGLIQYPSSAAPMPTAISQNRHCLPISPAVARLPQPPPLPFGSPGDRQSGERPGKILAVQELTYSGDHSSVNQQNSMDARRDVGYPFDDELSYSLRSSPLQQRNTGMHQASSTGSPANNSVASRELLLPPCPVLETPPAFADSASPPSPPQLTGNASTVTPLPPPPPLMPQPGLVPPPPKLAPSLDKTSVETVTNGLNGLTTTSACDANVPAPTAGQPADLLSAIRAGFQLRKVTERELRPHDRFGASQKSSQAGLPSNTVVDVQAIYDALRRRRDFMDSDDEDDADTAAGADSDSSGW